MNLVALKGNEVTGALNGPYLPNNGKEKMPKPNIAIEMFIGAALGLVNIDNMHYNGLLFCLIFPPLG
jgi:hypothetical protein